jgi:hypothetical protein
MSPKVLMRRHVALPADHGSWVFLCSPLLIGLAAGGRWTVVSVYLVVAALAGFLIRQPLTIAVKIYSGRRARPSPGTSISSRAAVSAGSCRWS